MSVPIPKTTVDIVNRLIFQMSWIKCNTYWWSAGGNETSFTSSWTTRSSFFVPWIHGQTPNRIATPKAIKHKYEVLKTKACQYQSKGRANLILVCGILVLQNGIAPSLFKAITIAASSVAGWLIHFEIPMVLSYPIIPTLSFTLKGSPWSGPFFPLRAASSSSCLAHS